MVFGLLEMVIDFIVVIVFNPSHILVQFINF